MYCTNIISLPCELYEKQASVHLPLEKQIKGCILYFHGGGLLYGDRDDLPTQHIETFTDKGFAMIAFDYPLAPKAKLELILEDVKESILLYTKGKIPLINCELPFFLFGRSAGAYLCLLAAAKILDKEVQKCISGVISYYGYGFLCEHWFDSPSSYYQNFPEIPEIPENILQNASLELYAHAPLETHYHAYVHARQKGLWIKMISDFKRSSFLSEFSLREMDDFPCPLFCAHSIHDKDVPYEEFLTLCERYRATRYVSTSKEHDFDRSDSNFLRKRLLDETVKFMQKQIK